MNDPLVKAVFGPMRIPFLLLVPVCVVLGAAGAFWRGFEINFLHLALAFTGALAAHISVNALNEYDDYKTGLDFLTTKTPFSGGSGTLPQMPESAAVALITGLVSLAVTVLVGVYFVYVRGVWLLPLGLAGIADILLYTRWLTRNPFLCLIAPGIGFGPLMVMGTDFVLTGSYGWTGFTVSMVPFFLVSNLLLLNQFPDAAADQKIGRRHMPIVFGKQGSVYVLGCFMLGAYLSVITGVVAGVIPFQGLIALITAVIAIPTVTGAYRYSDDIPRLIPCMAKNVMVTLLTPLLLALGLIIA